MLAFIEVLIDVQSYHVELNVSLVFTMQTELTINKTVPSVKTLIRVLTRKATVFVLLDIIWIQTIIMNVSHVIRSALLVTTLKLVSLVKENSLKKTLIPVSV